MGGEGNDISQHGRRRQWYVTRWAEKAVKFDKMVEKDSGVEGSVMSGGVGCLTGWPSLMAQV